MTNKNIVLVGFMGSGKTVTSKRLAKQLNREVVSTDKMIEQREGRLIARIFEESGEAYFRRIEKEIVQTVAERQGVVIDCGGGVVLDPENIKRLKKNGIIIYLSASPDSLYRHIKSGRHRPLLNNVDDPRARIRMLLKQRNPYYQQADVTIDTDHKSVGEIAQEILEVLPP